MHSDVFTREMNVLPIIKKFHRGDYDLRRENWKILENGMQQSYSLVCFHLIRKISKG